MNIIHTIVRNGQCIMPEVMASIIHNNCALCIISSWTDIERNDKGTPDRKNILSNWQESFKFPHEGYYIGMDSDVVLNPDTIGVMKHFIDKGFDVVTCGCIEQTNIQHHVFMATEKVIKTIQPKTINKCPLCSWINEIKESKQFLIYDLPTPHSVHTVKRIELKKLEE